MSLKIYLSLGISKVPVFGLLFIIFKELFFYSIPLLNSFPSLLLVSKAAANVIAFFFHYNFLYPFFLLFFFQLSVSNI